MDTTPDHGATVDSVEPVDAAVGSPTLGQLCSDLGPLLIDVVAAPRGIDVRVSGVLLHDPQEPVSSGASGHLLLAVGLTPADRSLESLVRSAAAIGAVAIACRASGAWSQGALDAAASTGVSLISVPPHVLWGELYELIGAAIAVDEPEPVAPVGHEWHGVEDLTSICEALAAIAGGAVGIDDMHGRAIAFSGGGENDSMRTASILNHRVPDEWQKEIRQAGVVDRLLNSDDVIHVQFDGLLPRRAIAIRIGRSVLGSIWLIGSDEKLSADADEALRRAAPIAALQMMRQRLVVNVERRLRESSLAAVLRGDVPSSHALEEVGLPTDERLVVVALEVISRNTSSSPAAVGPRLVDLLTMHLHAYQRPAVATSLEGGHEHSPADERVYVLAGSRGSGDRARLRRLSSECLAQASRTLGLEVRGGIGHEVEPGGDVTLARRSAEDCIAQRGAPGTVVAFEDIYDQALTADVDEFVSHWRGGPSRAYHALAEQDEANGTEYLLTLRCVLEAFGSAPVVAERLHLHVNTVRYRIKRIAEITGVDLADGDARLALELTLRAHARAL